MNVSFNKTALACAGAVLLCGFAMRQPAPAPQVPPLRVVPAPQVVPPPQVVPAPAPIPIATVEVVARHPHDPAAFTQGLIWHDGHLYESTGREGTSEIRRVTLDGRVVARAAIPPAQFGEGLALSPRGELVSLTWRNGVAYRWNARTLKRLGRFRYGGEGWGLTATADALILSDGSATLRFLDPATFAERRRVEVSLSGAPVDQLNELEMVDGTLYANVWHSGGIARIDPATGRITGLIDLRPLAAELKLKDPEAVLNGIAWDAAGKRLFVTGKLWPTLFEVRVVEPRAN